MLSHPRGMRLELKPSKTKRICLIGSDNLGKLHYILSDTKKKKSILKLAVEKTQERGHSGRGRRRLDQITGF